MLGAQSERPPAGTTRVLVIDVGDPLRSGFSGLAVRMRQQLQEALDGTPQFVVEHVDPSQLQDSSFVRQSAAWWDMRHDLSSIDALLIIGLSNARFIEWLRLDISPAIPVVFYSRGPVALATAEAAGSLPRVYGVSEGDVTAQVIPLIARLLPQTTRIVAIANGTEERQRIEGLVQEQFPMPVTLEVMERPTPEDIIERGKSLPSTAVFLFGNIEVDRTRRLWAQADFINRWATVVNRPIFVSARGHLGPGVLGGVVVDPGVTGQVIGVRLAAALAGTIRDQAPLEVVTLHPAVWRFPALRQFSIDLDSLPPDSEVLEVEPSVWQRYPRGSVAIVSFIVALVGLVGLLTRFNRLSRQRNRALRAAKVQTARAMASMAEWRDPETGEHIRRTQFYVKILAEGLRALPHHRTTLTHEVIDLIYESAPLHDIGKVAIRDSILLKPGKLTPEEFAEMQRHVTIGRQMLDRVQLADEESTPFMDFAKQIAQSHHEKWDGTGYPEQLAGEAIPLAARLMALADVYDALRSERPYKAPLPHAEVERIIVSERGRHFDPEIVDVFLRSREQFIEIADRYKDQPTTPP